MYCCENKCFSVPKVHVDGLACNICNSYGYCCCKCIKKQQQIISNNKQLTRQIQELPFEELSRKHYRLLSVDYLLNNITTYQLRDIWDLLPKHIQSETILGLPCFEHGERDIYKRIKPKNKCISCMINTHYYSCYYNRLKTFENWRYEHVVSKEQLSKAGFISLKDLDKVKCFSCGIIVYQWEPEDDPILEHIRHNRSCSFIKQL